MPSYTINNRPFEKKKFVGSRNGKEMAVWELELKDENGEFTNVEMVQLDTTPAPQEGATLEGTIDASGPFAAKFTKSKPAYGGGGSGGGKGDFRSPEQIMRSDAHGKAMHWCDIKVAAGEWTPINWEQYVAMVDRYYADIKGAA